MASKIKVDELETTSGSGSIKVNNHVGIGVTPESGWGSNTTALQIGTRSTIHQDSSYQDLLITNNAWFNGTNWRYIVTDEAAMYQQEAQGNHVFYVAPSGTADAAISWTTAMTIGNTGNVGIGVAPNSSFMLHLKAVSGEPQKTLISEIVSTGDKSHFYFNNGNGTVGSIGTNGSSTSYYTSSDYRLKENVVPMTGSIDRLKALNPSRFNFIADADTTVDGFLAHEAQEVVPEAITGTKDAMMTEEYEVTPAVMDGETIVTEAVMGTREVPDYQGIDQSKLVPLLVASLQEAIARIEQLENI